VYQYYITIQTIGSLARASQRL